jgi:hypothetical protein
MITPTVEELRRSASALADHQAKGSALAHDFMKALLEAIPCGLKPGDLVDPVIAESFGEMEAPTKAVSRLVDLYRTALSTALLSVSPDDARRALEAMNAGRAKTRETCDCEACASERAKTAHGAAAAAAAPAEA